MGLTWMYRYSPSNSMKLILPLRSVSKISECQLYICNGNITLTHKHLHRILSGIFHQTILRQQPLQIIRIQLSRSRRIELFKPDSQPYAGRSGPVKIGSHHPQFLISLIRSRRSGRPRNYARALRMMTLTTGWTKAPTSLLSLSTLSRSWPPSEILWGWRSRFLTPLRTSTLLRRLRVTR